MTHGFLISLMIFCTTSLCMAQPTSERAKRELAKRIDVKAQRFQVTLGKSLRFDGRSPIATQELIECAEDLSLLIDGLDSRPVDRKYVVEILRTAFRVEQRIISVDITSSVVMAWSSLHSDLDLLAKCYEVKWTDAVVTNELVAEIQDEAASFKRLLVTSCVGANAIDVKPLNLDIVYANTATVNLQVMELTDRVRSFAPYLKQCSVNSNLETDWRRLSARTQELVRLFALDSNKANVSLSLSTHKP